jgi:hypothetical protein
MRTMGNGSYHSNTARKGNTRQSVDLACVENVIHLCDELMEKDLKSDIGNL